MKVIAYYILHYGKEYLNFSMRSLYPYVDEIVILYSERPTHGTMGTLKNPDTRAQLKDAVFDPSHKVVWIDGHWPNETVHRNTALEECRNRGADLVVVADYDEIWTDQLPKLLDIAGKNMTFRTNIYMNHLWKGFDLICRDGHRQGRIYNMNVENKLEVCTMIDDEPAVYHFGYAISDDLMKYKLSIHGHISEFRKFWLEKTWLQDQERDVHPVCIDMWNPEKFDQNNLPEIMKEHALWVG